FRGEKRSDRRGYSPPIRRSRYLPRRIFFILIALRSRRTIAFLRRSRLLKGFSKRSFCLAVVITPACCTLRVKRRIKFSTDSLESLRVTCIILRESIPQQIE